MIDTGGKFFKKFFGKELSSNHSMNEIKHKDFNNNYSYLNATMGSSLAALYAG